MLTGAGDQCREEEDWYWTIIAGFPLEGTRGLGTTEVLPTSKESAGSYTARDAGTSIERKSLGVANASGIDGNAKALVPLVALLHWRVHRCRTQWYPLWGQSQRRCTDHQGYGVVRRRSHSASLSMPCQPQDRGVSSVRLPLLFPRHWR